MPFDQVMDFSVIEKLGKEDKYASQKDEYTACSSPPRRSARSRPRATEILTNTIVIHFFPNSWDLHKKIIREVDGKAVEELYDPNVDLVLDEVAKLAGQFGRPAIIIEGHTDSSMQGQVPARPWSRSSPRTGPMR